MVEATARFDGVDRDRRPGRPGRADRGRWPGSIPQVRAALEVAIERVRLVHAAQRRTDVTTQVVPGGTVTERWVPVRRVGLYVPGGLALYPSSVVMNVVPAQIAGVDGIAVASPPQKETGRPDARVLATCALLGVDEVYAVGGAQAIAMFAYGAGLCEPVDVVTGPGQHLRHRGQAAGARAGRHRRRGRPDRDRDPGRRHAPTRCTSRPT